MKEQIVVYIIVVIIYFVKTGIGYYLNKSKLGKDELLIDERTKKTKFLKQIGLAVASVVVSGYYIYKYSVPNPTFTQLLLVMVLGLFTGSTFMPVVMNLFPLGVYENGVLTLTGIKFFNKIAHYEVKAVKNTDVALACFYPHKKLLGKVSYMYVSNGSKKKLQRFVKAKI